MNLGFLTVKWKSEYLSHEMAVKGMQKTMKGLCKAESTVQV